MRRVAVVALLLCSACSIRAPQVKGHFTARGKELGKLDVQPDRCESGGNWSYHGVAFFAGASHDAVLELVDDPVKGWFVKVAEPKTDNMSVFDPAHCKGSEIKIDVERTRRTPQGFVSGHARFHCAYDDGTQTAGDLTFVDCD